MQNLKGWGLGEGKRGEGKGGEGKGGRRGRGGTFPLTKSFKIIRAALDSSGRP